MLMLHFTFNTLKPDLSHSGLFNRVTTSSTVQRRPSATDSLCCRLTSSSSSSSSAVREPGHCEVLNQKPDLNRCLDPTHNVSDQTNKQTNSLMTTE